jgi:hypothetical protein
MRSSSRPVSVRRILQLLLIAALVVIVRAPFLLHGDRFFDADEAVEGLMASHVLQGEHPAFLWGQRYKGVPEVYLAAAVFAATGPGVVALKSVTLTFFTIFVCLQFILVERLFSRRIAWMATAFLIVGPPSLVFWSLNAGAEVVMTMLAGTVMCLGIDVWRRTGSRTALVAACAAAGFGLWVQQFILYYWIALALAVLHSMPQRQRMLRRLFEGRDLPGWLRGVTAFLAVVALIYVGLGAVAFVTGGFDAAAFGTIIGVHHAQKLWNIGAALLCLAGVIRVYAIARQHAAAPLVHAAAIGFAAGYAPAIAAYAAYGGSPPIARADLHGVAAALSPIARDVIPIVIGFRSPSTSWLGVPVWLGLALAAAIVASIVALRQRHFTPLFHYLLLTAAVLFLVSGAFIDAQSYRYLMPATGALSAVLALGVWAAFLRSRVAGAVLLGSILLLFGLEQRAWFRQLEPDDRSAAMIRCLDHANVRTAFADYWVSYKLTFLTGERIIVAPYNGVDRYPLYTARVRAEPGSPKIPDTMGLSCTQDIFLSR